MSLPKFLCSTIQVSRRIGEWHIIGIWIIEQDTQNIDEDLVMLAFIDPIGDQEVVGDAFDEEVGAFEEMFGELEEMTELEELDEIENLGSEFNFIDALGELDA